MRQPQLHCWVCWGARRAFNKMPAAAPQTAICRPSWSTRQSPAASRPRRRIRGARQAPAPPGGRAVRRRYTAPGRPARNTQNVQRGQDPRGPINGYVAERSLTGTKTDTPLMETPQAISVIGREEIPIKSRTALRKHCVMRREFAARPLVPTRATTGSKFAVSMRRTSDCSPDGLQLSHVCVCHLEVPAGQYRAHRHSPGPLRGSLWRQRPRRPRQCGSAERRALCRPTTSRPASIRLAMAIFRSTSPDRSQPPPARATNCITACSAR